MRRSTFAKLASVSAVVAVSAIVFASSAFAQMAGGTGGMMPQGSTGTVAGMVPGNMAPAGNYQFMMGFGTMASMMGGLAGQPIEDEWHGASGDGLQRTTTGMMVWRKADNWTAFTNGYMTWVNGPYGMQMRLNSDRFPWEAQ